MAVTTKKLFNAVGQAGQSSTTVFASHGIELNNQDDIDVYVTKTTAGIAANNGKRILHYRQSTASNLDSNHPQVNNTDGLYFPAITASGGTESLENYQLTNNNNDITFNSALPAGAVVFVERRTRDGSGDYTTLAGGSTIRATEVNRAFDESNFTAQDGRNKALTIEGVLFRGDQPSTNFVTSDHIVAGTIVNNDIANDAVNGDKIADDAINSEHYVDGSIDTQHIGADQITNALIANDQIDSEHYVDGSIDRQHLEADIIDSTKLADNAVDNEHIAADAVRTSEIQNNAVTMEKLAGGDLPTDIVVKTANIENGTIIDADIATGTLDNRYYTEVELNPSASAGANVLDARYYTETEAEALFLRQDSSETIASGDSWSATDSKVATTAAIDLRVIELVDNVGGFVPIDNETSFPTENPDINTSGSAKGGTIVSVQTASTNLTAQSGTTLTIANGRGTGNAVIITGVTATIPQGFGFLVETTSTDHTYAFHRLVPKATEVATVAANAVNIAAAGANVADINNFADLYQISTSAPTDRADSTSLQLGDLWFDSSSNKVLMIYDGSAGDGFTAATPNASDLTNINIVAGHITFAEDLGLITNAVNTGSGNNSVNTVATDITNVNTVATAITNVNAVAADATDIGAVAAKATEIGRLGTAAAVADLAILGTTDVVADMNTLATADIVADMNTLATSDVVSDMNTLATTSVVNNLNTVAGISSDVTAVANDATDIGAVAAKATEIGRLGTADAVADMAILGTTDVVADMNTLATADIVADMNLLATSDVISDMNTLANADVISDMNTLATADVVADLNTLGTADVVADLNTLGTADVVADMNTLATSANVTAMSTCATNISNVNTFANRYRIASSNPNTSLDVGDLYFNTTQNELRVYNGSAWQGGVTASGSLAGLTANTFSDTQTINGNIIISGTVDGVDIAAFKTSFDNLSTDIVNDSSPQLGAALDGQNNNMSNIGTIDGANLQLDFGTI